MTREEKKKAYQAYLQAARDMTDSRVIGPAGMNVVVPPTIATDDAFREAYTQGYRHAYADLSRRMSVPVTAAVHVLDSGDGAFVDMVIWMPKP